jgi:hypothetical protein
MAASCLHEPKFLHLPVDHLIVYSSTWCGGGGGFIPSFLLFALWWFLLFSPQTCTVSTCVLPPTNPPRFPPTAPPASHSTALHCGHTKQSLASLRLTVMGGGRALVFVCAAAGNFWKYSPFSPLGFWKSRHTHNNTQPIMCWSGWHFGQWGKGDSSHLGTANDLVILFHHPLVNLSELCRSVSEICGIPQSSFECTQWKKVNPTTTNFRFYLWNCCNAFLCLTLLAFSIIFLGV